MCVVFTLCAYLGSRHCSVKGYVSFLGTSLWEGITDTTDVQHTVSLLQLDDMSVLAVMLGGHWDVYKDIKRDTYIMFIAEAVVHISSMINAYGGNFYCTEIGLHYCDS